MSVDGKEIRDKLSAEVIPFPGNIERDARDFARFLRQYLIGVGASVEQAAFVSDRIEAAYRRSDKQIRLAIPVEFAPHAEQLTALTYEVTSALLLELALAYLELWDAGCSPTPPQPQLAAATPPQKPYEYRASKLLDLPSDTE